MDTTSSFVAVVLLLAANGFFVAAEFALVKARSFRIEAAAAAGSSAAQLTVRIQGNLEAYLAACQLGITMASLGLGWVGEPAVAALLEPLFHSMGVPDAVLHTVAFITGFLIFSSLHIVIGEQVPKTFAIRQAEPVSIWVAYPLHVSYLLVWPLNYLLNKASGSILSLFGVQEATHGEVLTGEEIKGLVATSKEHGEIHHQQADMLRNLFEFDQRQVGRVMIPRTSLHVLDVNGQPSENLEIIRETEHSRFPVVDSAHDDKIVGILLAKDLHRALLSGHAEPWRDIASLCREPMVVPETKQVSHLFEQMRSERAHMAFVIDEYGAFVGIITLEDLLEEIVGEIHDETDEDDGQPDLIVKGENEWEAAGLISLSDLGKSIGLLVPADLDANTLSGLIMNRLARIPAVGDELTESGFHLVVMTLEERRVGRARIMRLTDGIPGGDTGDNPPPAADDEPK
jgi:CBS domain containing-hemolysin-like protein